MIQKLTGSEGRTAVFAGSFDPFTRGHDDIVRRGLELFDHIVIAIGVNASKPGAQTRAADSALQSGAFMPMTPEWKWPSTPALL